MSLPRRPGFDPVVDEPFENRACGTCGCVLSYLFFGALIALTFIV